MKVCKLKDVKPGEIFIVPRADVTYEWMYNSGVSANDSSALLTISDDLKIKPYQGVKDWPTAYHPDHPKCGYPKALGVQAVKVYADLTEIADIEVATVTAGPVNSLTGSDPEIFVTHGTGKRSLLPAFRFMPSQAEAGPPIYTDPAVAYKDGFAAEFSICPVRCHGYLIDYLRTGLLKILRRAQAYDRTAQLSLKNTFNIPKIMMDNASDEDVAFGCDPSLNAYDDIPEIPMDARGFQMRFAGGHVHLGLPSTIPDETKRRMVEAIDIVAAIPAVGIFASLDTPNRRMYYGRAGEYRLPKHGLEYRVLSNAWLAAPEISHLMLNLVRIGAKVGYHNFTAKLGMSAERARDIINTCDISAARKFTIEHRDLYTAFLQNDAVPQSAHTKKVFCQVVEHGIESVIPDINDMATNWKFNVAYMGHSDALASSWSGLCQRVKKFV